MARGKEPPEDIISSRLQVRLTESERKEFYDAWKELEPDLEWASFCRRMIRKGIELARIDAQAIKANRARLFNQRNDAKREDTGE
jgi:hypothetical protein